MESGKQTITLSAIKKHLWKLEIINIVATLILIPLVSFVFIIGYLETNFLTLKLFVVAFVIVGLWLIGTSTYTIIKFRKGTYFTTRTDILVSNEEYTFDWKWQNVTNRLSFKNGHYDVWPKHMHKFVDIYDMNYQALFHTAFIGDSFTLIEVRKNIRLVFNNKLFEIVDDL